MSASAYPALRPSGCSGLRVSRKKHAVRRMRLAPAVLTVSSRSAGRVYSLGVPALPIGPRLRVATSSLGAAFAVASLSPGPTLQARCKTMLFSCRIIPLGGRPFGGGPGPIGPAAGSSPGSLPRRAGARSHPCCRGGACKISLPAFGRTLARLRVKNVNSRTPSSILYGPNFVE
jgi:hypothetical protein